jgi:hypothetical protein
MGLLASELVDRVRQQAVLNLIDAEVAKVVDKIAPPVVKPADPGDKRDDDADPRRSV